MTPKSDDHAKIYSGPTSQRLRDIDILGPSDRRRVRSAQEKAALLAEVDAEGGKVRLVARRHNISESLIYNWRSARKAAAVAMGAPENVEFIPAGIIEAPVSCAVPAIVSAAPERERESVPPSASGPDKTGAIEITLRNGTCLVDGSGRLQRGSGFWRRRLRLARWLQRWPGNSTWPVA